MKAGATQHKPKSSSPRRTPKVSELDEWKYLYEVYEDLYFVERPEEHHRHFSKIKDLKDKLGVLFAYEVSEYPELYELIIPVAKLIKHFPNTKSEFLEMPNVSSLYRRLSKQRDILEEAYYE
jgi:hypothetical protein